MVSVFEVVVKEREGEGSVSLTSRRELDWSLYLVNTNTGTQGREVSTTEVRK